MTEPSKPCEHDFQYEDVLSNDPMYYSHTHGIGGRWQIQSCRKCPEWGYSVNPDPDLYPF